MTSWPAVPLVFLLLFQAAPQPPARAVVSPQAFVGTWVGTQKWAIDTPTPGARQDQPVALTLELPNRDPAARNRLMPLVYTWLYHQLSAS